DRPPRLFRRDVPGRAGAAPAPAPRFLPGPRRPVDSAGRGCALAVALDRRDAQPGRVRGRGPGPRPGPFSLLRLPRIVSRGLTAGRAIRFPGAWRFVKSLFFGGAGLLRRSLGNKTLSRGDR